MERRCRPLVATCAYRQQTPALQGLAAPSDVARVLISHSEDVLLGRNAASSQSIVPLQNWSRHVLDPLSLMLHGARRMATSFWIGVAFLALVPLVLYGVVAPLKVAGDRQLSAWMYAIWFYAFVGLLFAKPSSYALSGFSGAQAREVANRVSWDANGVGELASHVATCLSRAELETNSRLTSIRWLAGAALAIAAYMAKRGVDTSDGSLVVLALVPLVSAAIVAGFVSLYARAMMSMYSLAQSALQIKGLRAAKRKAGRRQLTISRY